MRAAVVMLSVVVFLVLLPSLPSAKTVQEELQIAIRRYMQCQADNVGTYNNQVQLSQYQVEKLQAELNKVKKELAELKAKLGNEQ